MDTLIDLKDGLLELFTKQKYCDITFACKDSKTDEWTKIGAHKVALTSVSDVFETMFFGEIVQNDGVKKEAEIKIEDINAEVFEPLLGFIYGKEITFDCGDIALQFLYAADKYNCHKAKNFAEGFLAEDVDAQDAITYYETAEMMSLEVLKTGCLKVFEEQTLEVFSCPNFVNAKPETLRAIFNLECLTINSELNVLWAFERYIDFNKLKDPEIANKVRPALNCIRFLTLEGKDVARTTLLTEEEKKRVVDKSLKEEEGLSLHCNKRGPSRTMIMMRRVQPLFTENFCCQCQSTNHSFWFCKTTFDQQDTKIAKSILKEVYYEYSHTVLSEYKISDLKKVYGAYELAELLN